MNDPMTDDELFDGELSRVNGQPAGSPQGVDDHWCRVRVRCAEPAIDVLSKCREVLSCVLRSRPVDWPDNRLSPWPTLHMWEDRLPPWFVAACAAETTDSKSVATAQRIARLPDEHRRIALQHTAPTLSAWISCFESFRSWIWWDARVASDSDLVIRYIVFDYVHSNWSLSWLLVASGAWGLDFEEYPAPEESEAQG